MIITYFKDKYKTELNVVFELSKRIFEYSPYNGFKDDYTYFVDYFLPCFEGVLNIKFETN